MNGERYEIENLNNRKRKVKVLGRASKVKSKIWSDSYILKTLIETGENSWIDLRKCRHLRKLEAEEVITELERKSYTSQ